MSGDRDSINKTVKYKNISVGIMCNVITFILILGIVGGLIGMYKVNKLKSQLENELNSQNSIDSLYEE